MSEKQRNMMPQSTAGLIRYFDESPETLKIKPQYVVIVCSAVVILELALKAVYGL